MDTKQIHITETISLGDGLAVTLSVEAHEEDLTIKEACKDDAYPEEDAAAYRKLQRKYGLWGFGRFCVTAVLSHQGVNVAHGTDHLGCCGYQGPVDFIRPGGYYPDMRCTAFVEMLHAAPAKFKKGLQDAKLPDWTLEAWQAHAALHGFQESA